MLEDIIWSCASISERTKTQQNVRRADKKVTGIFSERGRAVIFEAAAAATCILPPPPPATVRTEDPCVTPTRAVTHIA